MLAVSALERHYLHRHPMATAVLSKHPGEYDVMREDDYLTSLRLLREPLGDTVSKRWSSGHRVISTTAEPFIVVASSAESRQGDACSLAQDVYGRYIGASYERHPGVAHLTDRVSRARRPLRQSPCSEGFSEG
jgi:hypothetical protein